MLLAFGHGLSLHKMREHSGGEIGDEMIPFVFGWIKCSLLFIIGLWKRDDI